MAGKRYKIETVTGFADRVRTMFSFVQRSRANGNTLVVCWIPNDHCPGRYLDLFEPIPGIEFNENPHRPHYKGCHWLPVHNPYENYYYGEMIPLPAVQERINEVLSRLPESFVAVHARRTDKCPVGRVTTDEEFFKFIDEQIQEGEKVFLATDNRDTQDKFYRHYGDRLVLAELIRPSSHLRQTSLLHTVVDMFVCAQSREFIGTNLSGLSSTMGLMQREQLRLKALAKAEAETALNPEPGAEEPGDAPTV